MRVCAGPVACVRVGRVTTGSPGCSGLSGVPACRRMRSRAASRSAGVLTATVSTPGSVRRARPVSTPPGATSSRPVTPSSRSVAWHRSQRTGFATCATISSSARAPDGVTVPSELVSSGHERLAGPHVVGRGAQLGDGGCHVLGVERAGDLQRDHARLGRRGRGERGERVERAGRDHLPAAVDVRGHEPVLREQREDLVGVAAEDGAHAGGRRRRGAGHGGTADRDQAQRLVVREHAGDRCRGELADRVTRRRAEQRLRGEGQRSVGVELEDRPQAGQRRGRPAAAGRRPCHGWCRRRTWCRGRPGRGPSCADALAIDSATDGSSSHGASMPGDWAP